MSTDSTAAAQPQQPQAEQQQPRSQQSIMEHFWPEHLSGLEVRHKWPRGRNATIERVEVEEVHDPKTQDKRSMPVVYFVDIRRGLVCNKTNGRWLAKKFGGDAGLWTGQTVSLVAATRSNNTVGVDVGDAFEETQV